jgi:hypothetical protein
MPMRTSAFQNCFVVPTRAAAHPSVTPAPGLCVVFHDRFAVVCLRLPLPLPLRLPQRPRECVDAGSSLICTPRAPAFLMNEASWTLLRVMSIESWAAACSASSHRPSLETQQSGLVSGFAAVSFSPPLPPAAFVTFLCFSIQCLPSVNSPCLNSCRVQVAAYAVASACSAFWLTVYVKSVRCVRSHRPLPVVFTFPLRALNEQS